MDDLFSHQVSLQDKSIEDGAESEIWPWVVRFYILYRAKQARGLVSFWISDDFNIVSSLSLSFFPCSCDGFSQLLLLSLLACLSSFPVVLCVYSGFGIPRFPPAWLADAYSSLYLDSISSKDSHTSRINKQTRKSAKIQSRPALAERKALSV